MSEIQLQALCFRRLWNEYPATRRCFFAVPNGGSRNIAEATQFKASGLLAGVPDMMLVWAGKAYGFEFKTPTGRLSPAQEEVHKAWKQQRVKVYVIRTENDFFDVILPIIL